MAVTLAEAKAHLRIDHDEDDDTIEIFIAAAEGYLAGVGVDMTVDPLPPAITAATLLLIGDLDLNREASVDSRMREAPFGVSRLIAPYREATA